MEYSRFKNPFYKIEIGDASGENTILLPSEISRLLDKVEITESNENNCFYALHITLAFNEGSREPFDVSETANTNIQSSENISNQSGMLTDLVFSDFGNTVGITSLASNNIKSAVATAESLLSFIKQGESETKDNTTTQSNKKVHYLFQEGNQVKVTFGYISEYGDEILQRTVRGIIKVIQSEFSETGTRTTIQCLDPSAAVDQVAATEGIKFYKPVLAGASLEKPILLVDEDKKISEVIEELAGIVGADFITSDSFFGETLDANHTKVLLAGDSLHQFLLKKASIHNAYYKFLFNPKTGKNTIIFINKQDVEKISLIKDLNLFHYKNPGSIVKNINIRADFSGVVGHSVKGYKTDGTLYQTGTNNSKSAEVLFEGQKKADSDPTTNNANKAAAQFKNRFAGEYKGAIGTLEVSPYVDSPQAAEDKSLSKTSCQSKNIVVLDMNTLGHPYITPPFVIFVDGIGKRYKGAYKLLSVTHSLDSEGYTCKVQAQSGFISGEIGVDLPTSTKGETPSTTTLDENLFSEIQFSMQDLPNLGSSFNPSTLNSKAGEKFKKFIIS